MPSLSNGVPLARSGDMVSVFRNSCGGGRYLALRAFGAAVAAAAGFASLRIFDDALGFAAGTAPAAISGAVGAAAVLPGLAAPSPSAAMLLRKASMMLTTLFGRDGCS